MQGAFVKGDVYRPRQSKVVGDSVWSNGDDEQSEGRYLYAAEWVARAEGMRIWGFGDLSLRLNVESGKLDRKPWGVRCRAGMCVAATATYFDLPRR